MTKHSAGGTGGQQREFTGELTIGDNSFACLGAQKKIKRKRHENHRVTLWLSKSEAKRMWSGTGALR